MKITWFEKIALFTAGAGAAGKVLVWSLGAQLDSTDPTIAMLRVGFAWLSFVAFDLVIGAVVLRGWSRSGAAALAVSALASAFIALDVQNAQHTAALHAAPALTLAMFAAHLMLSGRETAAAPAGNAAPAPQTPAPITQAVQVNVASPAALPRTIPAYIAARAAEMSGASQNQIASELGTSADTVRRALALVASTETVEQE